MKVRPFNVLMKLVRRPGNAFLEENEENIPALPEAMHCMSIQVDGIQDARAVSHFAN